MNTVEMPTSERTAATWRMAGWKVLAKANPRPVGPHPLRPLPGGGRCDGATPTASSRSKAPRGGRGLDAAVLAHRRAPRSGGHEAGHGRDVQSVGLAARRAARAHYVDGPPRAGPGAWPRRAWHRPGRAVPPTAGPLEPQRHYERGHLGVGRLAPRASLRARPGPRPVRCPGRLPESPARWASRRSCRAWVMALLPARLGCAGCRRRVSPPG